MKLKLLAIVATTAIFLSSCSTSKTVLPYFQDISTVKEGVLPAADYLPDIKPADELIITVHSEVPQASAPYNSLFYNSPYDDVAYISGTQKIMTYVVDTKGDIDFPILGKIHVAGLNCEQLRDLLTERISKDVKDPLVTVTLANFKVVVAGEVNKPGNIPVKGNRVTVLDALSAAGDLTPYGERSNVLVIREENGKRTFAHLDLNSSEVLTSPYYYLQQNDYVYVEPNKIRQANSKYNQDNAYKLTVISTVVSACSVIASLVIALAIK